MANTAPGGPGKNAAGADATRRFWRRPFDADTVRIPRGNIHILTERCKGCAFCVEYCPTSVLELSSDFNAKGYHPPTARDPESCVQCQLCETICPEFAIFVTSSNGEAEKEVGE